MVPLVILCDYGPGGGFVQGGSLGRNWKLEIKGRFAQMAQRAQREGGDVGPRLGEARKRTAASERPTATQRRGAGLEAVVLEDKARRATLKEVTGF